MNSKKVRKVATSKHDRNGRDLKQRWEEILKKAEQSAKVSDIRSSFVLASLPPDMCENIARILKLDNPPCNRAPDFEDKHDDEEFVIREESKSDVPPDDLQTVTLSSDLSVNYPASRDIKSQTSESNPYLKFLNKPRHLVATWRPKEEFVMPSGSSISAAAPLLVDPKKTLSDKAKQVTNAIIQDFCQWVENLGGEEKSEITVDTMQQLFEIGFDAPAARSLCVRFEELPVVTETAARARNLPERSVSAALRSEILRDVNAERKPARLTAFGSALPTWPSLRHRPPRNQTQENWLDYPTPHKDLESMQAVWEGITRLRSARSYCEWLVGHPTIAPPPYLLQHGMLGGQQQPVSLGSHVNDV